MAGMKPQMVGGVISCPLGSASLEEMIGRTNT